ncbi:hypothetical protein [Aliikangiella coralliicola]|uniref:Linalool dehydratase/isomerase domain-containing protein n=1 Tax=Aliikangiella coralliicola TaxID=2592383 RepID=A0A545UEY4_9GAMM|nr:hypothetical protein [Aliikangiella coralliicola]TQV88036.1 hypothetical protein FLL46_09510 [Aliikangiella coralliicola]
MINKFLKKTKNIPIFLRSLFLAVIAIYFFLLPFGVAIFNLQDPGLKNGQLPKFTYHWHKKLAKDIPPWANERVRSSKASKLNTRDISGTEWPMFSAVYFLWATEALQDDWVKNPNATSTAPSIYAKAAINAAIKLITDPDNATWVKTHWGDDYLYQENIFYRMLLIAGLTSYQKLTGNEQFESLLINQVDSLSRELEASPFGLLDDYPGECYPVDILPALAVIQRAGKLLNRDHASFLAQSVRAFSESRVDPSTNLPAYVANSKTGEGIGSARGVGISYMLIWAPELWPNTASDWYANYEKYFWQQNNLLSGFREYPKGISYGDWFFEIDAGPVIKGYGVAASAFGIGAARVNNRFEHAYPLAAEAIVASWPLLSGSLLIPRALSNLSDAPYLGESALLFNMTRKPILKSATTKKTSLPAFVYLFLLFYALSGLLILCYAIVPVWRYYKKAHI